MYLCVSHPPLPLPECVHTNSYTSGPAPFQRPTAPSLHPFPQVPLMGVPQLGVLTAPLKL